MEKVLVKWATVFSFSHPGTPGLEGDLWRNLGILYPFASRYEREVCLGRKEEGGYLDKWVKDNLDTPR